MGARVVEVDESGKNKFRSYWESSHNSGSIRVYAKDELDAYTKATVELEERDKTVKYAFMSMALVIIVLILAITYATRTSRIEYAQNMNTCVTVGKNYVSENDGYSCRDGTSPKTNKTK
jgi:hypothetical protein